MAVAVLGGAAARGNVLNPLVDDSLQPLVKLRADIGKQMAKYSFCLVKAATKCEKHGLTSAVECTLITGAVSYETTPGKETTKFQDGIAKCDAKLLLTKKGTDYAGIGCPGDCDAAPGTQECSGIPAFEATIEATLGSSAPKVLLTTLAAGIDLACSVDVPASLPTDQSRKDCVENNAKALSKYSKGIFKCMAKCENDYKGSKGGGGLTNGEECNVGAGAPEFNTCIAAALAKAGTMTPIVNGMVRPLDEQALNSANNGLYNRFDPEGSPDDSPCGNCGNGTREGAEVCDGGDDDACPGACRPDCTCP